MQAELEMLAQEYDTADADSDAAKMDDNNSWTTTTLPSAPEHQRLTMPEYCAMWALRVASNFDGIAAARSEKPKRQIDEDRHVKETPLWVEGAAGDEDLDVQAEGAGELQRLGLGSVGQSLHIGHRFAGQALEDVLRFETRERKTAFSKELCKQTLMKDGQLPKPLPADSACKREELQTQVLQPYSGDIRAGVPCGLNMLQGHALKEVIEKQRQHFNQKERELSAYQDSDEDCPPPPIPASSDQTAAATAACFAPEGQFRRPSDFVAHQAEQFEKGLTGPDPPPGEARKTKRLTTDQVLFLAQFSKVCNTVWEEERNEVPMSRRQRFSLLLMGRWIRQDGADTRNRSARVGLSLSR